MDRDVAMNGAVDKDAVMSAAADGPAPGAWWRGVTAALVVPAALAAVLDHVPNGLNLTSTTLLFLAAVVAVARLGGLLPALLAALWAGLLLNYYFIFPLHSAAIADANNAIALLVFAAVALTVASVVDLAAQQSRRAARATAEAQTLNEIAVAVLRGDGALPALLEQLRTAFGAAAVSLLQGPAGDDAGAEAGIGAGIGMGMGTAEARAATAVTAVTTVTKATAVTAVTADVTTATGTSITTAPNSASSEAWSVLAASGPLPAVEPGAADSVVPVGPDAVLALRGRVLSAADRRVLAAFTAQAAAALERSRLARTAAHAANLEAADRMRTALLTAVSHDLRTPLSAARAAVGTLADPELDVSAADRAELLEIADESLARLSRLVADLLDLSRIQAGALKPRLDRVDPAEVLAPALDGLPDAARRVRLEPTAGDPPETATETRTATGTDSATDTDTATPPLDPPIVLADAPLLERVVANLVANALTHTDSPVSVSVAAGPGGRVELRVADRGPGIPAAARELVFRPFQRLGDRGATGVGLGLALARGLTEAMGGTLTPHDTPGGGLTMVISLPAAEPEPDPEPDPAAARPAGPDRADPPETGPGC